jgi:hypothetical protein
LIGLGSIIGLRPFHLMSRPAFTPEDAAALRAEVAGLKKAAAAQEAAHQQLCREVERLQSEILVLRHGRYERVGTTKILYHVTSVECAQSIWRAKERGETEPMTHGKTGAFGGGIYFADEPKIAHNKARKWGALIRAEVNIDYIRFLNERDDTLAMEAARRADCGVAYGRGDVGREFEYCVWHSRRVKPLDWKAWKPEYS